MFEEKLTMITNGINGHGQTENGQSNGDDSAATKIENGLNNSTKMNGLPTPDYQATNGTSKLNLPRYEELIGRTPLVDLTNLARPQVAGVRVLAKCEFLNPGFSMKDRIIKNILDKAELNGQLRPGGTIVAASSGNTGASVAMLAAMRGYKAVITTTAKCSKEKMDAIKVYGAELRVAPPGVPEAHPDSYMSMARRLAAEHDDWFDVNQYDNLDNPEAYYNTLGPEIWAQTDGLVSHFIAGGSTGGTISGTGRYLKGKNPDIKCILADPHGSIFYNYFKSGQSGKAKKFLVEGVGKDAVPGCMDFGVVDDVIRVNDKDTFSMCHALARLEGLMVGGSSGLNTYAAIQLANRIQEPAVIVTVLCDLGVKYLTKVYNPEWLTANNINLEQENTDGQENGGQENGEQENGGQENGGQENGQKGQKGAQ